MNAPPITLRVNPPNANAAILVNIDRAMDALEIIGNHLALLKDTADHSAATWPKAGDAGKIANDLAELADFCART